MKSRIVNSIAYDRCYDLLFHTMKKPYSLSLEKCIGEYIDNYYYNINTTPDLENLVNEIVNSFEKVALYKF